MGDTLAYLEKMYGGGGSKSNVNSDFVGKKKSTNKIVKVKKLNNMQKIVDQDEFIFGKGRFQENNSENEDDDDVDTLETRQLNLTKEQLQKFVKDELDNQKQQQKQDDKKKKSKIQIEKQSSGVFKIVEKKQEDKKESKRMNSSDSSGSDSESDLNVKRRHDTDSEKEELSEEIEQREMKKMKLQSIKALGIKDDDKKEDSDQELQREDESLKQKGISMTLNIGDKKKKSGSNSSVFKRGDQPLAEQKKTVQRDKDGNIVDIEEKLEEQRMQEELKDRAKIENKKRMEMWKKGFKQRELKKYQEQQMTGESFAQYDLSKDAEVEMMKRERFDDPMANIIKNDDENLIKKKNPNPNAVRLKCKYKGPINRFEIEPGNRWDGVVRGSGYEEKYFNNQNKNEAQSEHAYKNATFDL